MSASTAAPVAAQSLDRFREVPNLMLAARPRVRTALPWASHIAPYSRLSVIDAADFARLPWFRVAIAMQRGNLSFEEIDGMRLTCPAWIEEWLRAR